MAAASDTDAWKDTYAAELESSRECLRQSGMVESSTSKDLFKYDRVEHERKPPVKSPSFYAVAVAAVGNPGVLPDDYVHQIYLWLINVRTQHRASGLLTANQNTQFENWRLSDVGIGRDTIRLAYASLVRLNNQRSVPYGPDELWIKFLTQITFPSI